MNGDIRIAGLQHRLQPVAPGSITAGKDFNLVRVAGKGIRKPVFGGSCLNANQLLYFGASKHRSGQKRCDNYKRHSPKHEVFSYSLMKPSL